MVVGVEKVAHGLRRSFAARGQTRNLDLLAGSERIQNCPALGFLESRLVDEAFSW